MNGLTAPVSPNTLARFIELHSMSPLERLDERIRMAEAMVSRMSDVQRVKVDLGRPTRVKVDDQRALRSSLAGLPSL